MKAIMIMYDSLNRRMLEPYGCTWTKTPNFTRLAQRSMRFDNCYVGSLPCIPARRELHTGRPNFLHRSWGPLEPYDDSMPEILKQNGIYSHLITDHLHYWEDGGATYHYRYSSFDFFRGQEGDHWKAEPDFEPDKRSVFKSVEKMFEIPAVSSTRKHDQINRKYMPDEESKPQSLTFAAAEEFIDRNHAVDNWFLQVESFDPHEPFFADERYKDHFNGPLEGEDALGTDWPPYGEVSETGEVVETVRNNYAALLEKCDISLGKILDKMDQYDLWKDTMLIVCTDHGYLLGEHGWWAKNFTPNYNEIANTPLFIFDPRFDCSGKKSEALVQMTDLAATVLEFFGQPIPKDMTGRPVSTVMENNGKLHDYVVFGMHGMAINVTDGRYVYMHEPADRNAPFYEYTLMPMHMNHMFSVDELKDFTVSEPFSFTKGLKLLKIPAQAGMLKFIPEREDVLFDLESDPGQEHPINDPEVIGRMKEYIRQYMIETDAPAEVYTRYGIEK